MVKKYTNHIDIIETDIDTISKTSERLNLFQITKRDFENTAQEMTSFSNAKELLKNQEILLNRFHENDKLEKETYIKLLDDYLELITIPEINKSFYQKRKEIGNKFNSLSLNEDIEISTIIRIFEFLIPKVIKENNYNVEKQVEVILSILKTTLFDFRIINKFKEESKKYNFIEELNSLIETSIDNNHTLKSFSILNSIDENHQILNRDLKILSSNIKSNYIETDSMINDSNQLITEIESSQKEITNSLTDILIIDRDFKKTEGNINDLVQSIRGISGIVELIKNISEQTTLLAINASIEASRAGEDGKGFSVIAAEIRELSEQTTESVEKITSVIKRFEELSSHVEKNTRNALNELNSKMSRAQNSIKAMNNLSNQMNEIITFTKNLNLDMKNYYNDTVNIKSHIDNLLNLDEEIYSQVKFTGNGIYQLSKEINDLRKKEIKLMTDLRHKHHVGIVKIEEKLYYWWSYNQRLGYEQPTMQYLESEDDLFWEWYTRTKQNPNIHQLKSFKEMENQHLLLHSLEEKIRFLINKKEFNKVDELLPTLKNESEKMYSLLKILEKEI